MDINVATTDEASLEAPPIPRRTGAALAKVLSQYRQQGSESSTKQLPHAEDDKNHVSGKTAMTVLELSDEEGEDEQRKVKENDLEFDSEAEEDELFKRICGSEIAHINPNSAEYTESDGSSMTMETNLSQSLKSLGQMSPGKQESALIAYFHHDLRRSNLKMDPLEEVTQDDTSLDLESITKPNSEGVFRSEDPVTVVTNLSPVRAATTQRKEKRAKLEQTIINALQNMQDQDERLRNWEKDSDPEVDDLLLTVALDAVRNAIPESDDEQEVLPPLLAKRSLISEGSFGNGGDSDNSEATELTSNALVSSSSHRDLSEDRSTKEEQEIQRASTDEAAQKEIEDTNSSRLLSPRPHFIEDDIAYTSNMLRKAQRYTKAGLSQPVCSFPKTAREPSREQPTSPRHRCTKSDDIEWQEALDGSNESIKSIESAPPFCIVCGFDDPIRSWAVVVLLTVAAIIFGFGLGVIAVM